MDMKTRNAFGVVTLLSGLMILGAHVTEAQSAEQILAAKEILGKVPAVELPSRAAQLVVSAPAKEKAAVASAVGQAVALINPDMASAAVSSIAWKVPVVAPAAAAAAASKLPNSAAAIAVAAASVPGVLAGEVRTAVLAAVPLQAAQIASAFSRVKRSSSIERTPSELSAAKSDASAGPEKTRLL